MQIVYIVNITCIRIYADIHVQYIIPRTSSQIAYSTSTTQHKMVSCMLLEQH